MKQYRNIDTNEIWTEDEIKEIYESEFNLREAYPTFAEYMNYLLDLGRQRVGGIEEVDE